VHLYQCKTKVPYVEGLFEMDIRTEVLSVQTVCCSDAAVHECQKERGAVPVIWPVRPWVVGLESPFDAFANLQKMAVAERREAEPTTQHRNQDGLAVS